MQLYARPGWRMARQLMGDALVLVWVVACALVARWLAHAIGLLEGPAQRSGNTAQQMSDQLGEARDRVGSLPGIGDELASPFGSMAGGLQEMARTADEQVAMVHQLSQVAGWACFLLPVATVLLLWLPRRVRFVRDASAARRFIDADADLELFALRAMANLPMDQIARITPDPVGQWRQGNAQVIRSLAALELERTGLAAPAPVRPGASTRPRGH